MTFAALTFTHVSSVVSSSAVIYLCASGLLIVALLCSRLLCSLGKVDTPPELFNEMGSVYALTTAFLIVNLLSNVSELDEAMIKEVVAIKKLSSVVSILPAEQRVEARRLIFNYGHSIGSEEGLKHIADHDYPETNLALDQLRNFFDSPDAIPEINGTNQMLTLNYILKSSDFLYETFESREERIAKADEFFSSILWVALAFLYFSVCFSNFLITKGSWNKSVSGLLILVFSPMPCILIYIFSRPIQFGLLDVGETYGVLFQSSI